MAPPYQVLRSLEDWRARDSADDEPPSDASDRLKGVSVGRGGTVRVDAGGQVRARVESWADASYGAVDGRDRWGLLRARLHANVRVGGSLRLFAEGLFADEDGRDGGPRPSDVNQGEVQSLFVEGWLAIGSGLAGAWAGRRELLFGKQRLISPADWTNVRRPLQGAGAFATGRSWRVDVFAVRPLKIDPDRLDRWDRATSFVGAVAHFDAAPGRVVEAYVLHVDREHSVWQDVEDRERRWSLGAGSWGRLGSSPFDYDIEGVWQFGRYAGSGIAAGMATLELGWRPSARSAEPRIALGGDFASGDRAGDGLGTYSQLFPTGHSWFGWADLQARQNVVAARLTASAKPTQRITVRVDVHRFWRADADDGVYAATGAPLRGPTTSRSRSVATELDLQVKYAIDRHWDFELGWAHVWAGEFVMESDPAGDTDFGYVQLTFTF
ncbi:MAG: alginate export family protein [Planctomycetes bacterium]|nr:alginate export family protein [Planctomycetota bacterium]